MSAGIGRRLKIAKVEKWLSHKMVRRGLRTIFAITVTILLTQLKLDPIEAIFYDWRAGLVPPPASSSHIVLIEIDDKTLSDLQHPPTAREFSQALRFMSEAHPRFLVMTIHPGEFPGNVSDLEAMESEGVRSSLIFAEDDLLAPGEKKMHQLAQPFERVRVESAPLTRDHSMFSPMGVTRRVLLRYQDNWTLQAQMAMSYNSLQKLDQFHGVFRFLESDQSFVRFKSGFDQISFSDILSGKFDRRQLADRIVLIGRTSSNMAHTFMVTPTTMGEPSMSQLEVQANYTDSLLTNSSPRLTATWLISIITFLVSILTMMIVMRFRPVRGLLTLAASAMTLLLLSVLADWAFDWFFPVAAPALGIVICYYFALPYRLILENRKSWEFEEKNRLLTQVEELKSNFIKLMSHDLKTPIARIQAMTEIVLRKKESLTPEQLEALNSITYSSEELSHFIASILDLSRIQSNRVKLQLQTRDINRLLQKVVRNADDLARRKNIEVTMELEPLFSLRMDEDLMKQVFTNLIENAIKYSPENSRVRIAAREADGKIQVTVSDEGIGIPQRELPFVFEKFYRAQNAEFENTGTGLGLYLAKYFVQLHNGSIHVESAANRGSTFSVNLPLDMEEHMGGANV